MKVFNLVYQFSLLKKGMIHLLERPVIPAEAEPAPHLMRGIQVSSTGSLFSQGQVWIPVFTGMTTWVRQQKNLLKELKGLSFLRKQESRSCSLVLKNSKGISVLFLVIAMLLMVTIGYVFSYLIPMKQKTVEFPIYSTQAFFIAQSGAEFAVRYAADQGWRGATDSGTFDLDRLDAISRPLGNGTFTIVYDQPTNTLTSTGQITGSSENRVVMVSNFSPFLRLVFNSASPAPCWCLGTRRVQYYIRNVRVSSIVLRSFSATWTQTGLARTITRIDMNGTQKYAGNYANGGVPVNLNRPLASPTQTINSGQLVNIIIRWSANVGNPANINFYFYTGLLGAGDSYRFNLDPSLNNLPNCAAGC